MSKTIKDISPKRFKMVGFNRKFREFWMSDVLTIDDIIAGKYPSFFSLSNRGPDGNCEYCGEIQSLGMKDENRIELFETDVVYDSTCDVSYDIIYKDGRGFVSSCGEYTPCLDLANCLRKIGNINFPKNV